MDSEEVEAVLAEIREANRLLAERLAAGGDDSVGPDLWGLQSSRYRRLWLLTGKDQYLARARQYIDQAVRAVVVGLGDSTFLAQRAQLLMAAGHMEEAARDIGFLRHHHPGAYLPAPSRAVASLYIRSVVQEYERRSNPS